MAHRFSWLCRKRLFRRFDRCFGGAFRVEKAFSNSSIQHRTFVVVTVLLSLRQTPQNGVATNGILMESTYRQTVLHRAAVATEERVQAIAGASGLEVVRCRWNLDRRGRTARPHCIDLCIKNTTVKIYFLDCEIFSYADDNDRYQVEKRLQGLANELKAATLSHPVLFAVSRVLDRVRP